MINNNKNIKMYSVDEAKTIIETSIDQSAKRLQKRLHAEWKKQKTVVKKKAYANIAV